MALDQISDASFDLGVGIAFAIIVLAWNFDWKHYIRFWNRGRTEENLGKQRAFRAFFFLSFLGVLWGLISVFLDSPVSAQDFGGGLLVALGIIALFFALDILFRRILGPPV